MTGEKKSPQQSSGLHNLCFEPSFGKNRCCKFDISLQRSYFDVAAEIKVFFLCLVTTFSQYRSNMNNKPDMVFGTVIQKCEDIEQPHCLEDPEPVPVQGNSVLSIVEVIVVFE